MSGTAPQGDTIAVTSYYFMRNGRPCIPVMGEFHASRFPRRYWPDELRKMRAGGVTIVATYILWIHVEEEEGVFDWSGDRDIRAFVEACQTSGLQVVLRIGPFAHGECRNGGLPDWLYGRAIPVRSNDERYLFYVRRYFAEIARQLKGLLFKDGGPVIGIQIEYEYMHAGAPWEVTCMPGREWVPAGSDGAGHLRILKQIAIEAGLQTPLYTCTAWGGAAVPEHGFLPTHSAYAFTPWVPDPQFQQGPTSEFLFRERHKPAGLLYVSRRLQPGWQARLFQRVHRPSHLLRFSGPHSRIWAAQSILPSPEGAASLPARFRRNTGSDDGCPPRRERVSQARGYHNAALCRPQQRPPWVPVSQQLSGSCRDAGSRKDSLLP